MIYCRMIVVCFLLCMLLPVSAMAAMEIHPRLSLEQEYNDNIDLTADNEEEDWITTVEPGINLLYNNRSLEATIDYALRYRFYKDNDDENLDEFKDVQRADASVLLFPGRPFTLRASESITREALDERDDNEFNDSVNRTTVYRTLVSPEYNWRLTPTFSLVFGYDYDRVDYVEAAGDDSEEHRGRLSLVKILSAQTEIFARYAYTAHLADADIDDFDRQDMTLGVTHKLGARTTLSLEAGYADIEYDNAPADDTDSPTYLADLAYRLTEAVTLSLGYAQDFTVSAEDGLIKDRELSLGLDYDRETITAAAQLFWNQADYVRLEREDKVYGVRFDFSRQLARAITTGFDIEYERGEYEDPTEDVDRFTAGVRLGYEYRRFLASLGYRYRINESDLDSNDYTNNIVTLRGSVRF